LLADRATHFIKLIEALSSGVSISG